MRRTFSRRSGGGFINRQSGGRSRIRAKQPGSRQGQLPQAINASGPKTRKTNSPKSKAYQSGTASWYGEQFQGKPTASGEPYDMRDFTAAHPSLPLGSFVRVTNLRNGRSVVGESMTGVLLWMAGSSMFPTTPRAHWASKSADCRRSVWTSTSPRTGQ